MISCDVKDLSEVLLHGSARVHNNTSPDGEEEKLF